MIPVNMKKNQVTCECAECANLVVITPFNSTDEYDADHTCYECDKVVCESCHDEFYHVNYGDPDACHDEFYHVSYGDPDDVQSVCAQCFDLINEK